MTGWTALPVQYTYCIVLITLTCVGRVDSDDVSRIICALSRNIQYNNFFRDLSLSVRLANQSKHATRKARVQLIDMALALMHHVGIERELCSCTTPAPSIRVIN